MRYGSLCSGIEAATRAWEPLGWSPVFFSEIEKFPSAVLAHHYGSNMPGEDVSRNGIPNHGDMSKFEGWPDYAIDVLVGGTPCQSFSMAGLRKGLADPRGNLMLTFGAIAKRYLPRWLIWENVPGVLSSGGGRDFGSFLRLLGECGYGFAYRVLDAQYIRVDGFGRAVPQRRRRVFVIGYLGDWRPPAAVLFDAQSLRRTSEPCRKEGQGVAGKLSQENEGRRSPAIGWCEQLTARIELAGTLQRGGSGGRHEGVFADFLIRRYTPLECERLQGFSDDFTRIPWLGKAAKNCPNGLRYKALGNSMAVNCMRWLGRRIQIVEQISCEILADCGELAP